MSSWVCVSKKRPASPCDNPALANSATWARRPSADPNLAPGCCSSRLLVFGATGMAEALGVSDIIIGLTVVAIGTSLPELASSIIAARRGESDIALGNVIGSNLFNTLAVVGVSGLIHPFKIEEKIFYRDVGVMLVLTITLFIFCYKFKGKGRINRVEGVILLCSYFIYTTYLILFGSKSL